MNPATNPHTVKLTNVPTPILIPLGLFRSSANINTSEDERTATHAVLRRLRVMAEAGGMPAANIDELALLTGGCDDLPTDRECALSMGLLVALGSVVVGNLMREHGLVV